MAEIALDRTPGDLVIVACAAVSSVDDTQHIDIITAGAQLEPDLHVTHVATEADSMEPVRKYNRAHPFFSRRRVQYYVGVFRLRREAVQRHK
jgi:hypothetical protein